MIPPPLRILMADDDANFRRVLQYNLEQMGARVVEAASGEEALARFAEEAFDLVVTVCDSAAEECPAQGDIARRSDRRPG